MAKRKYSKKAKKPIKRMIRTQKCNPLPWDFVLQIISDLRKEFTNKGKYKKLIIFGIGFYSALRIGDILKLTWRQVLEEGRIVVQETKTSKRRVIHKGEVIENIILDVWEEIRPYRKIDDLVIFTTGGPRVYRGKQMTTNGANTLIQTYLRKQIPILCKQYNDKEPDTSLHLDPNKLGNLSSHTLRKTFARRVWEFNNQTERSLIILSHLLNHSSTATTRLYIGLTDEVMAETYKGI